MEDGYVNKHVENGILSNEVRSCMMMMMFRIDAG